LGRRLVEATPQRLALMLIVLGFTVLDFTVLRFDL
jgi:hypothetical protein